jgi:hypothetical protein
MCWGLCDVEEETETWKASYAMDFSTMASFKHMKAEIHVS